MITVGSPKNKRCIWRYQDMPIDKKGWVVDPEFRPVPFDMCHLKIKGKEKTINGWWTGLDWVSLRLRKDNEVIAWKFSREAY